MHCPLVLESHFGLRSPQPCHQASETKSWCLLQFWKHNFFLGTWKLWRVGRKVHKTHNILLAPSCSIHWKTDEAFVALFSCDLLFSYDFCPLLFSRRGTLSSFMWLKSGTILSIDSIITRALLLEATVTWFNHHPSTSIGSRVKCNYCIIKPSSNFGVSISAYFFKQKGLYFLPHLL